MDLDLIYKSRIGESHEAGLQAVYDAGLTHAAQAFVASEPIPAPAPDPIPVVTDVVSP